MANEDYKNGKLVEIVREFNHIKGTTRYEINGITQSIAVPFWREEEGKFKAIPKGSYKFISESGNNYLEITDETILQQAFQFQMVYVYSQISSKYVEDFPELSVLTTKYNELVDDATKLFSYLKSVGMIADTFQMTKVLSPLEPMTTWYMDEQREIKALPISELYGKFEQMIEHLKKILEEYATERGLLSKGIIHQIKQLNHGFIFEPITYDNGTWKKADISTSADGMGVVKDKDNFYFVEAGEIEIPKNAVDKDNNPILEDEYYYLNENGFGLQKEEPVWYYQPVLHTRRVNGKLVADVNVETMENLRSQVVDTDSIHSYGLATLNDIPKTFDTIEKLQKAFWLKEGEVVEVLGYYSAGDGAGHKRIIKAEDDGSGVQLSNNLWACIVHNGEVNVSWFGAKGDGVSDDSNIIDKVISYAELKKCIVNITKNTLIKKSFTVNNIILNGNNNEIICDFDISSSIIITNNVVLKNIIFKSSKRILNILDIKGNNNLIFNIKVFNTEKANFVPEPPNYIKYHQGCIYIRGTNNTVENSEFYNNEGAGIYVIGTYINIKNNNIHDNVSGIILDNGCENCYVTENKIINNNAVKTEGADGILSKCKNILVQGNIIRSSGEHGTYLQGNNTTCVDNIVENNEHCGIKFSNVTKGIISSNTVNNNTVNQGSNEAQIYLQSGCNGIIISQNINVENANNSFFIRIVDGGSNYNGEITVIQNKGLNNIVLGGTNKLNCLYNTTDGDIVYGLFSTTNIPTECLIEGNNIKKINLFEIENSKIINNFCDTIEFSKNSGLLIIGNNISNQTSQINTRTFIEFSSNNLTTKMDTALFIATEKKDNIVIKNNIFNLSKVSRGLYEPTVSHLSGDNWNISKNRIFGSVEVFCNYGNNHIITENFVNGNESLGYFGCSNSILTHNQAVVNFRSNVSGNISSENINSRNLNIAKLNTLYHGEKMKQENVYEDYISYMDEKTAYDKQQRKLEQDRRLAYEEALKENPNLTYEEFMSVQPMTLNLVEEPQPSENLKKFMDKYL